MQSPTTVDTHTYAILPYKFLIRNVFITDVSPRSPALSWHVCVCSHARWRHRRQGARRTHTHACVTLIKLSGRNGVCVCDGSYEAVDRDANPFTCFQHDLCACARPRVLVGSWRLSRRSMQHAQFSNHLPPQSPRSETTII